MPLVREPLKPFAPLRRSLAALAASCLLASIAAPVVQAQTARKPSLYENGRPLTADEREARKAEDARWGGPAFLGRIQTQAEFQQLARVYNAGTPLEIPHVLFVIDRKRANRIYYIHTPRYALHETFARERRLLSGDKAALIAQYKAADRRLLFGTLSWQNGLPGYTYEFWEGDLLTPELLALTRDRLAATFYEPLRFKSNSTVQEQTARNAGIDFVTQEALLREQTFLPLNTGRAQGRLRIVKSLDDTPDLSPTDIAVLDEVPVALTPVAGLVTQRPSTLLSHVNLLAKGWRIPNAYVRDAVAALREHDGQWVELTVSSNGYQVQRIAQPAAPAPKTASSAPLPKPDLSVRAIKPLTGMTTRDSRHCGVKAANLGALKAVLPPSASVPDGFCIPFAQYAAYMKQLGVPARVAALERRPDFAGDANVRRSELAALRQTIVNGQPDPALAASWRDRWQKQLQGRGVFVRSSSNSEDLPGFSGAGLYTTVPNVTQADALARAVRTVWASVYNFEAYEARRAAGIAQDGVVMAVLVQQAAASDSSGVMITRDPFDASRRHVTYLSAKRGLGIKVVEGRRQAEQLMYSSWSKAVQVLSRSAEDTQLVAAAGGGVREVPIGGARQVLDDALVARLAAVGRQVKKRLGNVDQDIEWAVQGDNILILQARPYIDGSR
ncbi:PEP/pyruvate-binding domain-containing protein [Achromobacter arsenitoxydans]|uniref:Phosphoenolpyruvate synthase n=1 Tax=Achromobacter arsenitoxydans SY8 TaxID=477184 RepID=H0F1T7_9BURK|nr:PEP/pyruvate-binding domain-containing protein [Achromobacter arsenitoxydans]EHK67730.1 pyruvate phosphate dikinase, PEP/pyruvate binding domain-containing protein [Achromobacter arsenitoxydans SY8]